MADPEDSPEPSAAEKQAEIKPPETLEKDNSTSKKKERSAFGPKMIFPLLLIIGFSAFVLFPYVSPLLGQTRPENSTQEDHYATAYGELLAFRGDLNAADKVKVYPAEQALYNELVNVGSGSLVKNITFAFQESAPETNAYFALQEIEIKRILSFLFFKKYGEVPGFDCLQIGVAASQTACQHDPSVWPSAEKLPGLIQNTVIYLAEPNPSAENSLRLDNHVITLQAQTAADLDLVTAKLLMVLLELKRVA